MSIYLDHAATSRLLPEAKAAMLEVMDGNYGNASSLHSAGRAAKTNVEEARKNIARLIGASPEEIIFTSGGSESNNTIIHTFAGEKVAVSKVEHPSVLESAKAYASEVINLAVDKWGRVKIEELEQALKNGAKLVSVMLANNELGTIEDIAKVAKCCKKYNIPLHSDATQAFGKIKIDVNALGVDYMTVSAHKIGGPIGIGALYVRKNQPYRPLLLGGHQESGRRAGTTNTMLAAGFGAAAKWCWDNWSCHKWAEIAKIRNKLKKRVLKEIPYSSCNSPEAGCLPNLLNISFSAAEGESIQLYLDLKGVEVGTGSACATGDLRPSHVIMATRNDAEVAHNSIRFSLGLDTTEEDIDQVVEVLSKIINRLQGISTIKLENTNV